MYLLNRKRSYCITKTFKSVCNIQSRIRRLLDIIKPAEAPWYQMKKGGDVVVSWRDYKGTTVDQPEDARKQKGL